MKVKNAKRGDNRGCCGKYVCSSPPQLTQALFQKFCHFWTLFSSSLILSVHYMSISVCPLADVNPNGEQGAVPPGTMGGSIDI